MASGSRDWVIGTAGHIDHGKTALVRALTGIDTDRLPAEKERGITIDLGFASLTLGPHRLAIVDVPGHERFIRNMLAGASGLDLAMLIVAADDSVMPQTREHLEILRLLGLPAGLVVLTKCDLADPTWLAMVEEDVRALVRGTFLENGPLVRTSAATGLGIDALKAELARLCETTPPPRDAGLFRMSIDRAFTVAGHGTVVTGTVASGEATVGDDLDWLPAGQIVRIRGLHRHDQAVERVGRGMRAAVNLSGVHHTQIERGQELAAPGFLHASTALSVELTTLADAPRALRHRGRYRLHLGTAEVAATLSLLEGTDLTPGGSRQLAQLFLAEPLAAVHGQPFVIREESPPATLGGGLVLQPSARRIRRRDQPALAKLDRLRSDDPVDRLSAALSFLGMAPWTDRELCTLAGLTPDQVAAGLARLIETGVLVELPIGPRRSIRFPAENVADLEDRVLRALRRLHEARPRLSVIPQAHLAAELPDLGSEALIGAVVERLASARRLTTDGRSLAIAGHKPRLSQAEARLKAEILEKVTQGGMSPPEIGEIATASGAAAKSLPDLVTLLCDERRIVEVSPTLYLESQTAAELRRRVADRLADGSAMTMADLRDLLGTTRKYAVPIGEYLDRIGLTRREGDVRRLKSPAPAAEVPSGDDHA